MIKGPAIPPGPVTIADWCYRRLVTDPKQEQQQDDHARHAEQPEQNERHWVLLSG